MEPDGDDQECLTDSSTQDGQPTWSPDSSAIYFASREPQVAIPRIDVVVVEGGARRTVVEQGWDPALTPDGKILLFVALDDRKQPRIFAHRIADGKRAVVTTGDFVEGVPTAVQSPEGVEVLFVD